MSGSVQEALPHVQEWSEGPLGDQEARLDVCEWSRGLPACPGVIETASWMLGEVGRPSRMSGSGQEALPDVTSGREPLPNVRECSGVLQDIQEWSGSPPGCPTVVDRPSRMSGSN